jgi:DNA-directed RNA polymerase
MNNSHFYLEPTCDNQVDLEAQMIDLGKGRFLSRLHKEKARGQEAQGAGTARVLDKVYPVVAEEIAAWKQGIVTEGKGRYPQAYAVLKDLEPELVAYIGIRVIFDQIMGRGGCPEHRAASLIGLWVEHECRVRAFAKTHKRYLEKLMKETRKRSGNTDYIRTVTIHAMNRKDDKWKGWNHNVHVSVGFVVIQCLLNCGDLIERELIRGSEAFITITSRGLMWINHETQNLEETSPIVLPCIQAPLPWTTPYDGGYHTEQMREKYPLLTAFHKKDRLELLEEADMPAVYRAINAVQNTAWRINAPVLAVMSHLWANRVDFGVLPEVTDLPMPDRPENIDTDPEVLRQWKKDASEVHTNRVRQGSKRMNLKRCIDVASEYKDRDLYYVHQCDFRGRLYAQGAGPNPQGTDYQKALIRFAEGKPIGAIGVAWLAIHVANTFGVDKVSLAERINWTCDNQANILSVVEDPLANNWWTTADSPWLFLAACYEWAGYVNEGTDFITTLPVMVDGSCNGLQHYSAMLRDPIGGEATNLVPMSTPQDIYGRVANVTVAKDPTLKGIVTRSVAKRPVMVLPYGGTIASCKDYVRAALREGGHKFDPERETEIATLVWNSIGDVVVAARDGMAFLRKMASAMSKKKEHVSWVAPSGWPVLQQYFDIKTSRLSLYSNGKQIRKYIVHEPKLDTVDGRRSGQGLPPNFVHSMDAAALVGMVSLALDQGINQFAVIHDSFGTLACDMDMLGACIRTSFVDMYENHDVLEELRERVFQTITATRKNSTPVNLEHTPAKGKLNIHGVLESPFFFA